MLRACQHIAMSHYVPAVTPALADRLWLARRPRFTNTLAALSRPQRASEGSAPAADGRVPTARAVSQLESALASSLASISQAPAPRPLGVPVGNISSAGRRRTNQRFSGSEYETGEDEVEFDDDGDVMFDEEDEDYVEHMDEDEASDDRLDNTGEFSD